MTPRDHDRMRVRLEELLAEMETLDRHLLAPLSLGPAITNLEMMIEVYEGLETTGEDLRVVADD
ncbi:hypothetical protein [Natrinema halophilum]|uniref:Uncharacterized protein n=1 Tax=Natrinema halophilum TaxID=1699371 RepID=A0A7D5KXE8_9EURY|nr:hypothetical protein [Natrinema halophilum]QLG48962.1 hypothetical protein HYG82_08915 [Natrinema halophilum]